MANKIFVLGILWVLVVGAYIGMALLMPAINEITTTASTELQASANMSRLPGTLEMVQSYPYWSWAIPGIVGIVVTVVTLKKDTR